MVGCPVDSGVFVGTSVTLVDIEKEYIIKVGDPKDNIFDILPPIISKSYCKFETNSLENIVGGDIWIGSSGSQIETSTTLEEMSITF